MKGEFLTDKQAAAVFIAAVLLAMLADNLQ